MNPSSGTYIDEINRRLVIRAYDRTAIPSLIDQSITLSLSHNLEKIWLWSFPEDTSVFMDYGFTLEGILEINTLDRPSASLAFYLTPYRNKTYRKKEEDALLIQAMSLPAKPLADLPQEFSTILLGEKDCGIISTLLRQVFVIYPTPVDNPEYLRKLMKNGCVFAGVFYQNRLVSVASAYPEEDWQRCELTDCATLEDFRGMSLTERTIRFLGDHLKDSNTSYTMYTLARARSLGINRVFHKLGYQYRGRLLNNCNIHGGFEDMNLWVRCD
jgi:putative beta-lysine N-acetyltransferase